MINQNNDKKLTMLSLTLYLKLTEVIQWNPVNADIKGTCQSVRIKRVLRKTFGQGVLLVHGLKETFLRQTKGFLNLTARVIVIRSNLKPYAHYKS